MKKYFFIFIGPESDHWLCLSLTDSLPNSLTDSCLVELMSQQQLKAFLGWKNLNLKLKPETWNLKAALDAELHIRNKWMIPTAAANVQHVFSTWLMWPWRVKMPIQNLLGLLLLLMFVMWIMLATVCCRFGSWGMVIKLNFCSDFEYKVWSIFWSRNSGNIFKLEFGQYLATDVL